MAITTRKKDLAYRCAQLRRRGMTVYDVSKHLGIPAKKVAALTDFAVAEEAAVNSSLEHRKNQEIQMLNELQESIYGQAIGDEPRVIQTLAGEIVVTEPDPEKIKIILLISKARRELGGLNPAKAVEVTGANGGPLTIEMIDACLRGEVPGMAAEISHTTMKALPAPDDDDIQDAEFSDVA